MFSEREMDAGYRMPDAGYQHPASGIRHPVSGIRYSDLLLEVGTEEIPASYLYCHNYDSQADTQPALNQMEEQISELLKESRIDFESVRALGTPRRLVLSVTGVSTRQSDRTVEAMGPPRSVAFDEEGKPTKAAEGFARKCGVTVDDLKVKDTERGEYVYSVRQDSGRLTIELLSEELPRLIASLRFPKSMHFSSSEDGNLQFARPIRWIVALLGEDVINFNVGRVRSDRFTFGHRLLSAGAIRLEDASPDGFRESLGKAGVIVDHEERRLLIRKQVTHALESEGCPVHIDEELLDTVTFLVEMPRAVVGTFSETYLSLPVEVLETAMKKHQRYFSFRKIPSLVKGGAKASLLPKFITITNGVGDEGVIRHGNERVLRSRLADAGFFYREDQKSRLADKTDKLNHVVFQEELGSLYDKIQRLKELAFFICENLGIAEENICDNAVRAAELCKVDLVTQMVIEFPSLQGIMGGYYAANSGETDEVAEAIRCHYYPTSPDGTLPSSITGSIVSIADKLDTIVGYFGIGNIPSGSQDPYSLRRQATGIVRILAEYELHLALDQAVEKALSLYDQFDPRVRGDSYVSPAGVLSGVDEQSLRDSILQFLRGRISALLSERGFTYDIINSILADSVAQAACLWDVPNTIKRADALSRFRNRPDFDRIYPAFNRVIRILPPDYAPSAGAVPLSFPDDPDLATPAGVLPGVDEQLFQDQAERNLYGSMVQIEEDVKQAAAYGEYDKVLDQLAGLRTVIDTFFDEVLVMTERDDLRNNRLTLLQRLVNMFSLVADFSMLVE
jgi:tetrameric-type glycyl-tRNA synthetase beta subunit